MFFGIKNSISEQCGTLGPSMRQFRLWLGLERLYLRFTQQKHGGRSHRLRPPFLIAPARRLSPRSRGLVPAQQGNFAQHKSRRHHPGSLVQYAD
jgi:hypothetical protein